MMRAPGRANSSTPTIETSAASEYAWVCAPALIAIAVLLPLLLTGKPRSRPAPAFDTPRARSSWFAPGRLVGSGRSGSGGISRVSAQPSVNVIGCLWWPICTDGPSPDSA
jgi:hypothetical protein